MIRKILFCLIMTAGSLMPAVTAAKTAPKPESPMARLARLDDAAAAEVAKETLAPNEINMIKYRRALMGRPGVQFYVVFFNHFGQPVDYFVTQGKCTSSKKRLIRPWKYTEGQQGTHGKYNEPTYAQFVTPSSGLDGTFGASDPYIYCRTVDGKYKQWNGHVLISDAPLEVHIKPIVIDASGKIQAQQ